MHSICFSLCCRFVHLKKGCSERIFLQCFNSDSTKVWIMMQSTGRKNKIQQFIVIYTRLVYTTMHNCLCIVPTRLHPIHLKHELNLCHHVMSSRYHNTGCIGSPQMKPFSAHAGFRVSKYLMTYRLVQLIISRDDLKSLWHFTATRKGGADRIIFIMIEMQMAECIFIEIHKHYLP